MDNRLKQVVSSTALAVELGVEHIGPELTISKIDSLSRAGCETLCFSKAALERDLPKGTIVIAPVRTAAGDCSVLLSQNPRLTFAKALNWLSDSVGFDRSMADAIIHPSAWVSPHAFVGKAVQIGARSRIGHFAVINDGVVIGEDCEVKPHAMIGEDGFGFERDELDLPVRLVHLGGVHIGNHVEIGSFTTVCRGTLNNTIVEDHVKVDSHVHIAHNCHVGRGAMVIACAEISGGVTVGPYSWIGPNASVIQQVSLGERSFVGIAANVTKSVESGDTVVGNPARVLRKSPT